VARTSKPMEMLSLALADSGSLRLIWVKAVRSEAMAMILKLGSMREKCVPSVLLQLNSMREKFVPSEETRWSY